MNDPKLNQLPNTVAQTGQFSQCRNSFGIYDMVGNLHEWTAAKDGTFRGGYYLDTTINGEGCDYRTTAHAASYHDYSTGFRCCADLGGRTKVATAAAAPGASPEKREPGLIHLVKKGESLWAIAHRYQVSVRKLTARNRISTDKPLRPGQKLTIP
jgi:LysM repeat protein